MAIENKQGSEVKLDSDAATYQRLTMARDDFLDRARENAKFTIPALMPPEGLAKGQKLYRPWQSVGSHGVNTLASKLVGTILPPNAPIFRFLVTDQVISDLSQEDGKRSEVEKKLNEVERAVQDEVEGLGVRDAFTMAMRQLIVSGNVLIYLPRSGNAKIYRLDQYVVVRDFSGSILKVIIKETVAKETLSKAVKDVCFTEEVQLAKTENDITNTNECDVYTVFYREGEFLKMYQSINGVRLPKSAGSWPRKKSPIMALRWSYQPGEDYGRGYVDDYLGDISAIEHVTRNLREGIAATTKVNPMVNPNGLTRAKDVTKAENLEVITGRAEDVSMLQFEKQADFQVAYQFLQDVGARLGIVFMMNQSVQRNAERVTAEEIRAMVGEIEQVLGGIYALLANELQTPFVTRLMARMVAEKKIPDISKLKDASGKDIAPIKMVTGIEALGRGNDYTRIKTLMQDVIIPLGPEGFKEIHITDMVKRAAVSLGIDPDGLLKSEEDKQTEEAKMKQMMQEQQQNAMMADVAGKAAGPVAKVAAEGIGSQLAEGMEE